MNLVKIEDGTLWPNPECECYNDIAWKMIHSRESLTKSDLIYASSVMVAYHILINHPEFSLGKVTKKISGIRNAIKDQR